MQKAEKRIQKRISVEFKNTPIEDVIRILADQADIDIIKSPAVTGTRVTVRITDVPLEEALNNILAAYGYSYVLSGNTIRVITAAEKTERPEILQTKTYEIVYADVREVIKALDKFKSKQGTVASIENTIIVMDTESKIENITALIKKVDREGTGAQKPAETEQKTERSIPMLTVSSNKDIWESIKSEYDISKTTFGKKINFVSDSFKRKIIFRDVEHAFVLASQGFSKPALILAGGVIEELLRLYLAYKKIKLKNKWFADYIKACEDNDLLKRGVSRLTDSIRDFRNLVHLDNEKTKRHTVSKATAKGAVSSIFTIANDFQ